MLDFSKHIRDLLHLHDCVVLPGLGGFVANYRPAELDPLRHTASPPSKTILFNHQLVHNDGLLFAHVSGVTGYGYKDVQRMCETFTEEIRRQIRKGGKFMVEGLGYLYLDRDGQVQFNFEGRENYLLESYGLPYLQYSELEPQAIKETFRVLVPEKDPAGRQKRIRRLVYGVAAACIVAALVLVPIRTGYFNQAGIEIPIRDSFQKVQPASPEGHIQPSAGREEPAGQLLSGSKPLNPFLPEPEYDIVVGSFRDFSNARQLRYDLVQKGYNPRILTGQNGFYRVSAGTYKIQDQAANQLAGVREQFSNAWILSN